VQRAQVAETPRAQALVDELNRRWRGQEACDEGPVVIQSIELLSPPAAWPPRMRIDFTLGERRGVWEREFDLGSSIDNGPVWSAAEWFARIAWTAFLEMQDTHSKPRGLRMLDG
jgi:hypothetical protein